MYPNVKIVILFLTSVAYHYAMKPPTPRLQRKISSTNDNSLRPSFVRLPGPGRSALQRHIRGVLADLAFSQAFFILNASFHALVLALLQHSTLGAESPLLPHLCAAPAPSLTYLGALTPRFLAGAGILLCAAALRRWCYTTMGRMFTFEVSIKADHARVVTRGPYVYVRHPSYTGGLAMLAAAYLVAFGADGYVVQCGVMRTRAVALVYAWAAVAVYGHVATYKRTIVEDEALRARFGETWEEYRRNVPYRLVPFNFQLAGHVSAFLGLIIYPRAL